MRLMELRKQIIFSCFLLLKNWCVLWKGASYGAKNTVGSFSESYLGEETSATFYQQGTFVSLSCPLIVMNFLLNRLKNVISSEMKECEEPILKLSSVKL